MGFIKEVLYTMWYLTIVPVLALDKFLQWFLFNIDHGINLYTDYGTVGQHISIEGPLYCVLILSAIWYLTIGLCFILIRNKLKRSRVLKITESKLLDHGL